MKIHAFEMQSLLHACTALSLNHQLNGLQPLILKMKLPNCYRTSIILIHSNSSVNILANYSFAETRSLCKGLGDSKEFSMCDGIWRSRCEGNDLAAHGGFGDRGVKGMIAAKYALVGLYLGICLSMQISVIEMSRSRQNSLHRCY